MTGPNEHGIGLQSMASDAPYTLADRAYAELEALIVGLELLPGADVTEKQLCSRIGMGRTPVREALLRLRYSGLIEIGSGRGLVVAPLYYETMLQVLEVDSVLAHLILPRAAERRTSAEVRRLQSFADAFAEVAGTDDLSRYMRLHSALLDQIGTTAQQPVAWRLGLPLMSMTRRLAVVRHRAMGDTLRLFGPHYRAVAQALANGDPGHATECLHRLIAIWTEVIESLAVEPSVRDLFAALQPDR